MAIESMLSRMRSAGDTTRVIRESRNEAMRVILEVLQGSRKGRSFMFDRHDTFIVGQIALRPLLDARGHGPFA